MYYFLADAFIDHFDKQIYKQKMTNKYKLGLSIILLFTFFYFFGDKIYLTFYSKDSRHSDAAIFLLKNRKDHYGVIVHYLDSNQMDITTEVHTYKNEKYKLFDSLGVVQKTDTLYDHHQISKKQIIANVNLAFECYENNPLNLNVSDSIFYEYVLPYRVGYEKVENWRPHFHAIYTNYLKTYTKDSIKEKNIIDLVDHIRNISYHVYNPSFRSQFPISFHKSLTEIRTVPYPYHCDDYAIYKLYSFRSLGIPAAYEVIPLYGKFNYGHAETSMMYRDGKFYCTEGNTDMPYKYQIAKMYRMQYSRVKNNPYDLIKMLGEEEINIPDYFNMPFYIDITRDRTIVSDITIKLHNELNSSTKVYYLCVYNGGEWKPIDWAKKNKVISFKNIGRKNLYQLADYVQGNQRLLDHPFVLDTLGNILPIFSQYNPNKTGSIKVEKFDRNNLFESGNTYILYHWDSNNKKWKNIETKKADENGKFLIASQTGVLFKIEKKGLEITPSRPFTIQNDQQIWW